MKFKDVEHLYLGCQIIYPDGMRHRMVAVSVDGYDFDFDAPTMIQVDGRDSDSGKPILRRLKDLTLDEANQLGLEQYCTSGNAFESLEQASYAWFRLLSWHYDLFGLIDSGEAIDAKTLEVLP